MHIWAHFFSELPLASTHVVGWVGGVQGGRGVCAGIRGGVSPNQTITQLCSDSLIWSQLVIQRFLMRKSHFSKHMDFSVLKPL